MIGVANYLVGHAYKASSVWSPTFITPGCRLM
jgi:hypothetical protein